MAKEDRRECSADGARDGDKGCCDNELAMFMVLAVMFGGGRVMSHTLPYMRSVRHRDGGADKKSKR